jgi:hypothetical protein
MIPRHYNKLKDAIAALPSIPRNGRNDMRYRWDLYHLANPGPGLPFRFFHEFYNDNHIDTALRKIVKETEK